MADEGCIVWRMRHRDVTESTNKDALAGEPGDVFTADLQTAGRGRLDHRWLSPSGKNLMMSAVIDVSGMPPEEVAALPLAVGLAVSDMVAELFANLGEDAIAAAVQIKWPNDILVAGRKICGILCERKDDRVIAGIGLNVNQMRFPEEIDARATSIARELGKEGCARIRDVRDSVLEHLGDVLVRWRREGFMSLREEIARRDFLRGKELSVVRTDADAVPVTGMCGGIGPDGALMVDGVPVYAGEAHVACFA